MRGVIAELRAMPQSGRQQFESIRTNIVYVECLSKVGDDETFAAVAANARLARDGGLENLLPRHLLAVARCCVAKREAAAAEAALRLAQRLRHERGVPDLDHEWTAVLPVVPAADEGTEQAHPWRPAVEATLEFLDELARSHGS